MLKSQWLAIVNCDVSYDGCFYYGVKSTGIFCRPSCPSRTPSYHNVLIFPTADEATDSGFRPCKRCKPDQPHGPTENLIQQTLTFIDLNYNQPLTLDYVSQNLHISKFHLHHLFKGHVGLTPSEYLIKKRIQESKQLLKETNLNMTAIAISVGFNSAGHFSTVFRKHQGQTPTQYRADCQKD